MGIMSQRIVNLVPALGIIAFVGMILLNTTALSIVRGYSYRIFFITHLAVAFGLPPLILIHHSASVFYIVEALVVFILDLVLRKRGTLTVDASLDLILGSNLIRIVLPVTPQRIAPFRENPGTHVYLSIPEASRPSSDLNPYLFEFMFNPFTIAAVSENPSDLTLVARCREGPMTRNLARLANGSATGTKMPLSIEGPYGYAVRFPNLAGREFDQLLLVAGGVGASFILPLYRSVVSDNPEARVNVIWAVRSASDATWPVTGTAQSILDDDRVQIFLTGDIFEGVTGAFGAEGNDIEMTQISRGNPGFSDRNHRRPDLQKIVDDVFRQGGEERVAVLVCGPEGMATELRKHVGAWVRRGRRVFWHSEGFAW